MPIDVKLRLPRGAYGLAPRARVIRHDDTGTRDVGLLGDVARSVTVSVGPLQPVVLEIRP
jgi:hypothetical protein